MAKNKQIRNIAIVGTGVIGASWAALYLARGFQRYRDRSSAERGRKSTQVH